MPERCWRKFYIPGSTFCTLYILLEWDSPHVETEDRYNVYWLYQCVKIAVLLNVGLGWGLHVLHRGCRYSCIYQVHVSPTLNGSSIIQCFTQSDIWCLHRTVSQSGSLPYLFSCLLSKQSFKIKCWTSVTRLKTQKMKSHHQSPHTEARTQQTIPPLTSLPPILERVSPSLQTHQDYNTATVNSTSQTVKKKTTWNLLITMHTRRSLQAHNRCEELPLGLQSKATKEELYLRL